MTGSLAAHLPAAPGVYRFRDGRGGVLYVGRAVELRRRVASYFSDLRDRRHLAPMVRRIERVEAVVCDSAHEAAWLERNVLEHRMPRWNRTPGGQEVPVHIRLDTRPGAPGVSVAHRPEPTAGVHYFGPYLGGEKVRLAVAALHRVYPLAYTGTRLSGSQRDMAEKLQVRAGDRADLVDALTEVLLRRRDIRPELAEKRGRAATNLAFELAGRLQAELEAIEWITAPQRVTRSDPDDLDLYGWAGGVLVEFQIRAGRLRAWTQRACSQAGARERVAATPPDWQTFARRNAELAATLWV